MKKVIIFVGLLLIFAAHEASARPDSPMDDPDSSSEEAKVFVVKHASKKNPIVIMKKKI